MGDYKQRTRPERREAEGKAAKSGWQRAEKWRVILSRYYESVAKISSSSFDANGLIELIEVIGEDFTNLGEPVSLNVKLPDGEINVDSHTELAQYDKVFPTIQEVTFLAASEDIDEGRFVQRVFLYISRTGGRLTASGTNVNWVGGNLARIESVLATKQAPAWYKILRFMFLPITVILGITAIQTLILATQKPHYYYWVSAALFLFVAIRAYLLIVPYMSGGFLPYTLFVSTKRTSDVANVDKIKIIVAVLTLIAAILALIEPLLHI